MTKRKSSAAVGADSATLRGDLRENPRRVPGEARRGIHPVARSGAAFQAGPGVEDAPFKTSKPEPAVVPAAFLRHTAAHPFPPVEQMTAAAPDEIRNRLKQHYLFNCIDDAALNGLAQAVRRVSLTAGEILFHQGAESERFYLIGSGQIKLSRISPAGQEKVIEVMYPGSTFAEAVMFMHKPAYPVTAQALVDSVLYAIPNQAYRNILTRSTDYCFRLLADLSMRLHHHVQEIDHLSQQNAMHRLIRYLLYQVPAGAGPSVSLTLNIPKQILASKLSIKPESFSRLLAILSQEGIISVDKQDIVIHDVERLKNYE